MDLTVPQNVATVVDTGALIAPVWRGDTPEALAGLAKDLPESLRDAFSLLVAENGFTGKSGSALLLQTLGQIPARRLILIGIGDRQPVDAASLMSAFGSAAQSARTAGARDITIVVPAAINGTERDRFVEQATTGAVLGLYTFDRHKSRSADDEPRSIERVQVAGAGTNEPGDEAAARRGMTVADAVALARDLVNEPAAALTPEVFAAKAKEVAEASHLEIDVFGPDDLNGLGATALAAVGRGSIHKPYLIQLRYRPSIAPADDRVIGLVGKCITFDTGGYSIKTYEGMLEMKGDMAGGAAVLAVMSVLHALDCPVAVNATICAAENMISGDAFRPGDILTAMNGVKIEVLSTDAEGRLVLADGLVYAARQGATELIDLATLTGAIMIALGEGTTGLFSNDDRLANDLLASSDAAGERFWRMPLIEALREKIRGDIGDIKNSGGRGGGAITAALFLERFREGLPWAHLDIAGAARFDRRGPLGPKGGTGVGVLTLLDYVFSKR